MTAEINFSVGDRVIHTVQDRSRITIIGKVTRIIEENTLFVEIQFGCSWRGEPLPGMEYVEREIPVGDRQLVNLSRITSTAKQEGYLADL